MGGRGSASAISGTPVAKGGRRGYSTMRPRKVTHYVGAEQLRKMSNWKKRRRAET